MLLVCDPLVFSIYACIRCQLSENKNWLGKQQESICKYYSLHKFDLCVYNLQEALN